MFMIYEMRNTNPSLGPIKDDQQTVKIYDRELGNFRTVITTPEEADEFIATRNSVIKGAEKKGLGLAALATTIGAGVSAGYQYFKNTKLNKLIDQLNPELEAYAQKVNKDGLFLKYDFLNFKNIENLDLSDTFSTSKNLFEKVKLTKQVGELAILGALLTACLGLFIPYAKVESADKKVTQEFINANK